jgi:ribA/ribD-fused uncharacterized protein
MMAEKARLFGDDEVLDEILSITDPKDAKALGRKVRDFDGARWEKARMDIVVRGNEEKFGQNPNLRKHLVSTKNEILVEASPSDAIWEIGLSRDDARAKDPRTWRGSNLLGFALTHVRDSF